MLINKNYLRFGCHFKNEAGFDGATDGGSNVIAPSGEAVAETSQPQPLSDADLINGYLNGNNLDDPQDEIGASETNTGQQEPVINTELFTVKINGEEKQVSRDELIAHFENQGSSNQNNEETVRARQEIEQQRAVVMQQHQQAQNVLNQFASLVQQWQQEQQPDWQRLLVEDPHQYLLKKAEFENRQVQIHQAQIAQENLNQQKLQYEQQISAQHLEQEGKKILDVIPEWKDSVKRAAEEQELVKFLTNQGYTRQELEGLSRSKANNIALVVKAMRYDKLMTQSIEANKQVKNLPPRIERPGVTGTNNGNSLTEAKQRLARSGSINDATTLFEQLLTP